jgi:hypothetical protein
MSWFEVGKGFEAQIVLFIENQAKTINIPSFVLGLF